jgi:hypothetical protein
LPEKNDKVLPKDIDSDYSIPGRFEESNSEDLEPFNPKPKNRLILVIAISTVLISSGFFSYYFINQNEIDSQIIQNTGLDPEKKLLTQYNVGKYGSDHAHAAIGIFIEEKQQNYSLPQFQISSKYIHFENNNPYLIHRHAIDAPLEILFASIGIKITPDCISLNYESESKTGKFCKEENQSLMFYVNGEKYHSNISQYVFEHNDKIMISFGDEKSISKHLRIVESLKIPDIPKKTPQQSGDLISI